MNTYAIFISVVAIAFVIRVAFYQRDVAQLLSTINTLRSQQMMVKRDVVHIIELNEEAEVRNKWLDYLFREFSLHIPNPYVVRPTFEEKRCYHCHYPEYAGHDPECAWLVCRPITSVLYPPPAPPAVEPVPDGNTILPVIPTDDDEYSGIVEGQGVMHGQKQVSPSVRPTEE
jgi:hypothetical protein